MALSFPKLTLKIHTNKDPWQSDSIQIRPQQFVGPDLGLNCLQGYLADDTSVNKTVDFKDRRESL